MKLDFETNTSTVNFVDKGFESDFKTETEASETLQILRDGIKAAQTGNRVEARQLLLRVTDAEPNNENAWLWLASISEYPEELLIFLNNVLSINPTNERALEWAGATKSLLSKTFVQRGIDASKQAHTDFAKQCFLQAIVHDTQNEMAWLWLASVCDSVEEKSAHLQKVLNINPKNETAASLLYSAKRQLAEAEMQKAIAAAVADDHTNAHRLIQLVLRQDSEFEEAWVLKSYLANSFTDKITCFKKILEINPDNGLAQVSLISLLGMMAKAESKPENSEIQEQTYDVQQDETEQETAMVSAVEIVEPTEKAVEVDMSDDQALENYFAEPTHNEEVLEEQHFTESVQPAEENLFAKDAGQDNFTAQESELSDNVAFSENSVEEQNHFEAAELSNNDVPELEFDAIEMNQGIELENLDDDFDEVAVNSPSSVEMEAEVQESVNGYENYADQKTEEPEVMESADNYVVPASEMNASMESVEENKADNESLSDQELEVSEEVQLTYPTYSFQDSEVPHEMIDDQLVEEEVYSEKVEDFTEQTEELEVSMTVEETSEMVEETPGYVEIEEEVFSAHTAAESDYAPQTEVTEQHNFEEYENDVEPEVEEVEQTSLMENVSSEEVEQTAPMENVVFEEVESEQNEIEEYNEEKGYLFHANEKTDVNGYQLQAEENSVKPQVEMIDCPFCRTKNDSHAFVCNCCHAMLSMSDLEMLLGHQGIDSEILTEAVERMESDRNMRDFSSDELKFLGIGQINLKHLREGFSHLKSASKLNPNDVLLSSQVNALAIRLSEIEQQESVHNSMPKNRTILVVDDSATVRKLVSGKLEKCGHEVVCAIDGVDALEKINALVPDLILLDITMPRMDGYQVCKLIRSNEATKDVPIVMISGKDGFFDKVRGRMAGTTGYITKPFGPETLMKTVEAYIVQA